MSDPDGFLRRWSRLKEKTRDEDDSSDSVLDKVVSEGEGGVPAQAGAVAGTAEIGAEEGAAEAGKSEEESSEVELPDLESLTYDSDYTAFLSEKVSDSVRNLALRKLWRSNPVLANLDGLAEYDDDFTDAATVVEGMKSAYQAGRGYLDRDAETPPEQEMAEAGEVAEQHEETASAAAAQAEDDTDQPPPPDEEAVSEPVTAELSPESEDRGSNRQGAERG